MEILNLPFEQSKAEVRATLEIGRNLFNLLLLSQKLLIHGRNTAFARLSWVGCWCGSMKVGKELWDHQDPQPLRSLNPAIPTDHVSQCQSPWFLNTSRDHPRVLSSDLAHNVTDTASPSLSICPLGKGFVNKSMTLKPIKSKAGNCRDGLGTSYLTLQGWQLRKLHLNGAVEENRDTMPLWNCFYAPPLLPISTATKGNQGSCQATAEPRMWHDVWSLAFNETVCQEKGFCHSKKRWFTDPKNNEACKEQSLEIKLHAPPELLPTRVCARSSYLVLLVAHWQTA